MKNNFDHNQAIIENLQERVNLYKNALEKSVEDFNGVVYSAKEKISMFDYEREKLNKEISDLQDEYNKIAIEKDSLSDLLNNARVESQNNIENLQQSLRI